MVEPKWPIPPVGSPLFVALSQASAKHSLVVLNSPTLQATLITKGRRLLLVSELFELDSQNEIQGKVTTLEFGYGDSIKKTILLPFFFHLTFWPESPMVLTILMVGKYGHIPVQPLPF